MFSCTPARTSTRDGPSYGEGDGYGDGLCASAGVAAPATSVSDSTVSLARDTMVLLLSYARSCMHAFLVPVVVLAAVSFRQVPAPPGEEMSFAEEGKPFKTRAGVSVEVAY